MEDAVPRARTHAEAADLWRAAVGDILRICALFGHGRRRVTQRLPLRILEDVRQCTYLVTDKIRRTFKLLYAVSQAMPVVTPAWITATLKAGRVLRTRRRGELLAGWGGRSRRR